jgi:predicted outer membrane repeat protein
MLEPAGYGGAIYNGSGNGEYGVVSGVIKTLTNCTFINNKTDGSGGAIYNTDAVIEEISGCRFSGNSANGHVYEGSGGAIYNDRRSTIKRIIGCTFRSDEAWFNGPHDYFYEFLSGGGGICNKGEIQLIASCAFIDEKTSGYSGGAIYNHGTDLPVVNCTFYRNYADGGGGGIYNFDFEPFCPCGQSLICTNCLFWGNHDFRGNTYPGDQIDGDNVVVNYCCIQGASNFGTIFGDDPQFVDPDDPDGPDNVLGTSDDGIALVSTSPCVDAGDDSVIGYGYFSDVTGRARFVGTVDIGAYEYNRNIIVRPGNFDITLKQGDYTQFKLTIENATGGILNFNINVTGDGLNP